MNLGVWMSSSVWQHKCDTEHSTQAWNLPELPDGFLPPPAAGAARLYVATRGRWRGYFRVHAFQWNPADRACPVALLFAPQSWTPIEPQSAPPRDPRGYTLDVPLARPHPT
jgi:hypothetical protein